MAKGEREREQEREASRRQRGGRMRGRWEAERDMGDQSGKGWRTGLRTYGGGERWGGERGWWAEQAREAERERTPRDVGGGNELPLGRGG